MKQIFTLIILITLLISCSSKSKYNNSTEKKVTKFLNNSIRKDSIPGLQVVVIKNSEIKFSKALGFSNVPFSVKTKKTLYFQLILFLKFLLLLLFYS